MSQSSDERKEVLQMLAEGKLTADEAAKLLNPKEPEFSQPSEEPMVLKVSKADTAEDVVTKENGGGPTWFHVRVTDLKSGKGKVTVNIPLRLVQFGFAIGKRFAPELEDLDWQDLSQVIASEKGVLIDVQDDEDGEHVQIYVD